MLAVVNKRHHRNQDVHCIFRRLRLNETMDGAVALPGCCDRREIYEIKGHVNHRIKGVLGSEVAIIVAATVEDPACGYGVENSRTASYDGICELGVGDEGAVCYLAIGESAAAHRPISADDGAINFRSNNSTVVVDHGITGDLTIGDPDVIGDRDVLAQRIDDAALNGNAGLPVTGDYVIRVGHAGTVARLGADHYTAG